MISSFNKGGNKTLAPAPFSSSAHKFYFSLRGLALLIGVSLLNYPAAPPNTATFEAPREEINMELHYYSIQGSTLEELKSAIAEKGPRDYLGQKRDAALQWTVSWQRENKALTAITVKNKTTLTLPRWDGADSADPILRESWHKYMAAILKHEKQHLRHLEAHLPKIKKRLQQTLKANPSITSQELNTIGHQELELIRKLDRNYDRVSDHGRNEGVLLIEHGA